MLSFMPYPRAVTTAPASIATWFMPAKRMTTRPANCMDAPVSYTHLDVYKRQADDGAPVIETCGLEQFGFLELQFYKPAEEWAHSFEKLYIMSIFQITGKEVYKNMDTISFSQDTFSMFKQNGTKLTVIGGI